MMGVRKMQSNQAVVSWNKGDDDDDDSDEGDDD